MIPAQPPAYAVRALERKHEREREHEHEPVQPGPRAVPALFAGPGLPDGPTRLLYFVTVDGLTPRPEGSEAWVDGRVSDTAHHP